MPTPDHIRLYYFTGKQWGIKALWEKRLKVSQYAEVNDPFELAPFDLSDGRSRAFWSRRVAKLLAGHHGILCFSQDWRSVLMWAHYAEKHAGLCLGFDVLRQYAEPIIYIDRPLPDPMIDHRAALRGLTEEVLEAALRHKHSSWSYEQEWRLRVRLEQATDGIFYKAFADSMHLREVIIGPRCSLVPADIVDAVSNPPMDVHIFKARASFGSFDVCRHEAVATHTAEGFRARLARAPDLYADQLPDE